MRKFTIPKGKHSSGFRIPKITFKNTIKFTVVFLDNCLYDFRDKDDKDINKLTGLSDSWSLHHHNSIRIGWLPEGNKISLYLYTYRDKTRYIQKITTVKIRTFITGSISIRDDYYSITIGKEQVRAPRYIRGAKGLKYYLYPYFGGDNKSPHTINILLS